MLTFIWLKTCSADLDIPSLAILTPKFAILEGEIVNLFIFDEIFFRLLDFSSKILALSFKTTPIFIPFFSREIDEQIEINAHYRGYLRKQKADILAFKRDENLLIPDKVDYDDLAGLSNEVKAKFKQIKPKTMGQALRIDGITPAAVYILLSHLKRKSIKHIA